MRPEEIAFEFIERCSGDPTVKTVATELTGCASRFGFDRFLMAGLPTSSERFERLVLLHAWPQDWYERFTSRNYFQIDGVGQWAAQTNQPFAYDEVPDALRLRQEALKVRAEARSFGLSDGFVVPIPSTRWRQSAASFSCGCRCDLGPHERATLHLVAIYAEGVVRSAVANAPARPKLTAREREVLAWTAAGKSAWETSVILSVSERTITKHLEHVRTKLGAATTVQAVAEAFRLGEIVL